MYSEFRFVIQLFWRPRQSIGSSMLGSEIGTDTVVLWLGAALLVGVVIVAFKRRLPVSRAVLLLLFGLYVVFLLGVTLFPLPIDPRLIADERAFGYGARNNFVPLATIREALTDGLAHSTLRQLLGNLVLLLPLTLLGSVLWNRLRSWRRALLAGFLTSLLIEVLQFGISAALSFTYKVFDVDDVLLNTLELSLNTGSTSWAVGLRWDGTSVSDQVLPGDGCSWAPELHHWP